MATIQLDIGDQYDKQCGEIFLTLKGNIVFHCTLCENKFERFETYADHILALHYMSGQLPNIKQEIIEELHPDQLDENSKDLTTVKRKKRPQISELMMNLFEDDNISEPNQKVIKQEVEETIQPSISGSIKNIQNDVNYLENYEIKIESDSDTDINSTEDVDQRIENSSDTLLEQSSKSQQNDGLYKCLKCGLAFTVYKNLEYHLKKHNPTCQSQNQTSTQQLYVCTVCGKGFQTTFDLQTHMEFYINEDNTTCTICEIRFESNHSMHRHFAIHVNERHYKCDICDASFKKQKGLLDHKIIHDEKTFFSCILCGAQFTLKAGLKWHMRTYHSKNKTYTFSKSATYNTFEITEPYLDIDSDVMISAALL